MFSGWRTNPSSSARFRKPSASPPAAPEDGSLPDEAVEYPLELFAREPGGLRPTIYPVEGLGHGAEQQRDLGLLGREEVLQDAELDTGLGRREGDRHLVEMPLELLVDVGFVRHAASPIPTLRRVRSGAPG